VVGRIGVISGDLVGKASTDEKIPILTQSLLLLLLHNYYNTPLNLFNKHGIISWFSTNENTKPDVGVLTNECVRVSCV
jgi:hypothetical protein